MSRRGHRPRDRRGRGRGWFARSQTRAVRPLQPPARCCSGRELLLCQVSAGQTPPERPKFPSCSRGNAKHRLHINIAAFSARRFVLAPAFCSLLPCLPLPERMRSARRLPKNTPAGNCRGWRAENCRDAARPPQERSTQGAVRAVRPLLLPGPAKKILPGRRRKALPFVRCHGCQHVVNYSSGL